ncbi:MAG: hypothetical protein SNJ59_03425 [Aggregatilineales bacterium]
MRSLSLARKVTFAMNDTDSKPAHPNPELSNQPKPVDIGSLRSPVRPTPPPDAAPAPRPREDATRPVPPEDDMPTNPDSALRNLRQKMEQITGEFASGRINRAQFNALYRRYSEQRIIIERLMQRNPETEAWRQVIGTRGHTTFLRSHFEAQPLYYATYMHDRTEPIHQGGSPLGDNTFVVRIVQAVWQLRDRPKVGVGRRPLPGGQWLILAVGEYAITAAIFSLEPSLAQARFVRDLHLDFERANLAMLERRWLDADQLVFPQRALLQNNTAL